MASRQKKKRCMATGGAFGESGASGCSGGGGENRTELRASIRYGGMARLYVRGIGNVHKKLLIQAAACNLALLMRSMYGAGKPRAAHDQAVEVILAILTLIKVISSISGSWCTNSGNLPGQANRLAHG
jgi:hypothetical protein